MAYSLDLREQVVARVEQGHSIEETATLFQVSPATIYRWRQRPSLARTVVAQRRRKLDPEALRQPVRDYPEARFKTGRSTLVCTRVGSVTRSNDTASPSHKTVPLPSSATIGNSRFS